MKDRFGRSIEYMRISITDRCDLRCRYCMPQGIEKVGHSDILSYEDIERICEASVGLGITKFKITGGEPLVRLGCSDLVRSIKAIRGVEQVTLTTNGTNLARHIDALKDAGIDAVNISLDTMDSEKYRYITQLGDINRVMEGIDAAIASGVVTKINCVPQRGFSEDEIANFAHFAFDRGIDVRFIELMPLGSADASRGISNKDILDAIKSEFPRLTEDNSTHGNGPAVYYNIPGSKGSIGLISAMHGVFCSSCNRIRLTSQGLIKPCLCYEKSIDIRPALAGSMEDIQGKIKEAIMEKPERHCFINEPDQTDSRSMSEIGG